VDDHAVILAPTLADLGVIGVAQDGEQPGAQVRARIELVHVGQGLEQRFLDQIVSFRAIARQRPREGAQRRKEFEHLRAQGGGVHLSTTPFREIPFAIREQVHSAAYLSGESGGQLGMWQKRRSVTVRDFLNGYLRL